MATGWKTLCVIASLLFTENAISSEIIPFKKNILKNTDKWINCFTEHQLTTTVRKSHLEQKLKSGETLINLLLSEQNPEKRCDLEKQLEKWKAETKNLLEKKSKKSRFSEWLREHMTKISCARNQEKKPSFLSINGKDILIYPAVILNQFANAFYEDISDRSFKQIDRKSSWGNYSNQCAICSLNLTPEEEKKIPKFVRLYANLKGGLLADEDFLWDQIVKVIKYRILIYESKDGYISGFYEYGKNYLRNGTKRIFMENNHYRELIVFKGSPNNEFQKNISRF